MCFIKRDTLSHCFFKAIFTEAPRFYTISTQKVTRQISPCQFLHWFNKDTLINSYTFCTTVAVAKAFEQKETKVKINSIHKSIHSQWATNHARHKRTNGTFLQGEISRTKQFKKSQTNHSTACSTPWSGILASLPFFFNQYTPFYFLVALYTFHNFTFHTEL